MSESDRHVVGLIGWNFLCATEGVVAGGAQDGLEIAALQFLDAEEDPVYLGIDHEQAWCMINDLLEVLASKGDEDAIRLCAFMPNAEEESN